MSKLSAAFWLGLVLVSGFTTFKVKYAVQDIEEALNRTRKHAVAEQQEIRVLAAEWTYLTQPERLAELNRRFLQLSPVAAKQLQPRIEDLPLRPPAAPAAPAAPTDVVVAANAAPPSAARPTPAAGPSAAAPATAAAAAPTQASRALALAAATLGVSAPAHAATLPRPPVQLAKATGNPLDALFAQIAEAR
jgi:hypothetical protein